MHKFFLAAGALAALAMTPVEPVRAAGFALAKPDTAGLVSEVEQVAHRRHRHRPRVLVYRHRHLHHSPYAYRYYSVPRYVYRPYYYSTWSHPYGGVYLVPPHNYYGHHRHW